MLLNVSHPNVLAFYGLSIGKRAPPGMVTELCER